MPNIIKDHTITNDTWTLINDVAINSADQLPAGDLILPLALWQQLKPELKSRKLGIWLNSDEPPEALKQECQDMALIAINFPAFADGRGYSYATILRAQYHYTGELRAIGDVLKDQLSYMARVGFNSFAMREDQKLEEALNHLADFSVTYQAAIDNPQPLFQAR